MDKMLKSVTITLALLVASAAATNVKQCKNGQPFPLSVKVEGCEETPCDIIKGTSAIMYVHFVGTKDNIRNLSAKIRATTFGITVPYELPEDLAAVCSNLMYDATCPIYETEDVTYQLSLFIDSYYPEISVAVEVSLNDENDESVACFICNVKVKKGATNNILMLE